MATARPTTVGGELEQQLLQALRDAAWVPLPGARDLPVLYGIDRRGDFIRPQENVLIEAAQVLVESQRVFTYGNSLVLEMEPLSGDGTAALATLRTGSVVESSARGFLANLFVCQQGGTQCPPPGWFVSVLLRAEPVLHCLPRIRHYALRPVFDEHFNLRGPGWHADVGILIHGPDVEPVLGTAVVADGPALDRLPPHLRTLLQGFCFRSDADLANAVALFLTGLLVNHFVTDGKPIALIDGNQPNLGKTWLVRVLGLVLDGVDPRAIPFTANDEELEKKLCATLREERQTIVLIDNAKFANGGEVKSPTIEANSTAPELSLRILGKSENYSRPNDLIWSLTMNQTRVSQDTTTRGLPIRLFHEGQTENRAFAGPNPLEYARAHRLDLLSELAGLVVRWTQQGRPPGSQQHRLAHWARIVGGILATNGLPVFLTNYGEAAATFNTALDELSGLVEAVLSASGPFSIASDPEEGGVP